MDMDLVKTREELVALTQRVVTLEEEVATLRLARHDHANKLFGLAEAVKQIQADLAKLRSMPEDMALLAQRLTKIETTLDDHLRAVVTQGTMVEARLRRLETRLAVGGLTALVTLEVVSGILNRVF